MLVQLASWINWNKTESSDPQRERNRAKSTTHRMIMNDGYCPLASGSKGNCTFLGSET